MAFEEIDDFGFSTYDIDELPTDDTQVTELQAEIDGLRVDLEAESQRARDVYDKIQPFLNNLMNAEKDYIYWPVETRRAKLEQFRLELQAILQAG